MVGFADVRSAWWHCCFVTSVGVEDNGTPVLFSPFPIFVSARGPRRNRLCSQMRTCLLPDADVSAPRRERVWDEARLHTVPRSLTSIGEGGKGGCSKSRKIKVGKEATAPLKGRAFKIEISKVSGSALVAEICTDPHNRLLRRQHCSSLCLQSEGHEHVANMASALGQDFVGFSVLVRHNIRPPHFASKVSYSASPQASAKCSRDAPCNDAALACYLLKNEPKFSWILNTLSYRA